MLQPNRKVLVQLFSPDDYSHHIEFESNLETVQRLYLIISICRKEYMPKRNDVDVHYCTFWWKQTFSYPASASFVPSTSPIPGTSRIPFSPMGSAINSRNFFVVELIVIRSVMKDKLMGLFSLAKKRMIHLLWFWLVHLYKTNNWLILMKLIPK